MKVIIAGSRGIKEAITGTGLILGAELASGFNITEVVSGGAEGIDKAGERFAHLNRIPVKQFAVPDWVWDAFGKKAGPLRNKAMAAYADALIAIWDGESAGTYNMIREMQNLRKPVKVFIVENGKLNELKASL